MKYLGHIHFRNCRSDTKKASCFTASALLVLILSTSLLSCQKKAATETQRLIYSGYVSQPEHPAWDSPAWAGEASVVIDGEKESSENLMTVYSEWNQDSLWFFFKVTDSDLRAFQTEKDHPQLYLDDMVEVLLDTRNDKDSCWDLDDIVYHVNILGQKKDDRGSAECLTNPLWDGVASIYVTLSGTLNDTTDIDKGYLITLVFPWEELDLVPQPGLMIGINFANGDNDGKGRQLFDWVGAWPMRSPYAFGNLTLR